MWAARARRTGAWPLFLLLASRVPALAADVPFDARFEMTSAYFGASVVAVGDLDRDGDQDYVVAGTTNGLVTVARNDGSGTNGVPVTVDTNFPGASAVAVADLDGDGDPDIAAVALPFDRVAWWSNGGGTATNWTRFNVSTNYKGPRDIAAADVDLDGHLDLVTAGQYDDDITWWENQNGAGTLWSNRIVGALKEPTSVTVADVDRDGKPDVVSGSTVSNQLVWFRNLNGSGLSWTTSLVSITPSVPVVQRAADMDADGDPDIVGTYFSGNVRWWANPGGAGSWAERVVESGFSSPLDARVTDLDRDGDPDIVGLSFVDDKVVWWENLQGVGTNWLRHDIDAAFSNAQKLTIADMDSDADLDVVAAAAPNGDISLWKNLTPSNATFFGHTNVISLAPGEPASGRFGDLNRDGNVDVVTCATNGIAWWAGSGGQTPTWTLHTVDAVNGATHLELADLDQDGDTDIVGADYFGRAVRWWENSQTNGSVWTARTIALFAVNRNPLEVAVGDLNRDGRLDVVAVHGTLQQIAAYLNAGGATNWTTNVVSSTFEDGNAVGLGDLDRDGDLDLAVGANVGSGSTNQVAWFENLIGGTNWLERTVDADGEATQRIFAKDFDHDGDLDLVGTGGNPNCAWWENTSGSGTTWQVHGVETTCCFFAGADVAAFDADFDGDEDLAYISQGYFIYYENDGSHTNFARRIASTFDGAFSGVATDLADVNRDGLPDVLVVEYVYTSGQGRLRWFRNSPHGNIRVTKLASEEPAYRGREMFYQLRITNQTANFVRNVTVQDTMPTGVVWLASVLGDAAFSSNTATWTLGDFAGNASTVLAFAVRVHLDATGSITNTATYAATITDTNLPLDNAGSATTTVEYAERILVSASFSANAIAVSDLDRDGDLDIAAGRSGTNPGLVWFENTAPDGEAWLQHTVSSSTPHDDLRIADLNRDGHPDIVTCDASHNSVQWYANDGTGGTWTATTISGVGQARSVDPTDVDADGDDDLLVAASGVGFVALLNASGTGSTWNTVVVDTALASERSIHAVDFDLDGDADFVGGASEAPGAGGLKWYENLDRSGTNWAGHTLLTSGVFSVHADDVDGDGDTDIVSSDFRTSGARTNVWWENLRLGGTNWIRHEINLLFVTDEIASADVDRDADADVLLATSAGLKIMENVSGLGTTWKTNANSAIPACTAVALGDINRDGALDVVVSEDSDLAWWYLPKLPCPTNFPVRRNLDTNAAGPMVMDLADVDRDGNLDVLGALDTGNQLVWWRNVSNAASWTTHVVDPAFNASLGALAVDLDRDGDTDLVSPSFADGTVRWWASISNGAAWSSHQVASGLSAASAVDTADFDLDGDPDLVVGRFQLLNAVVWFSNLNGQATAWSTNNLPGTAIMPLCVHAARLNADARPDFAVGGSGGVVWYENVSPTSFIRRVVDNLVPDIVDLDSVDMDRDGDTDLLGATEDGNRLYWWENTDGSATNWTTWIIHIDLLGASGVRPVDIDCDGDPDVAATALDTNRVIWMENRGPTSNWVQHIVQEGFTGAVAPLAADLNRDGEPDIAAAAYGGGLVSWWEQQESGTDFDGDGLPDEVDPDDDNDGMPDAFEEEHGFNPYDPSDAYDDEDGDDIPNLFEYIGDTGPTNGNSFLQVFAITSSPTRVSFSGSFDRAYTLQFTTNPMSGGWSDLAGQADVPGAGAGQSLTDTNATDGRDYRIRVELP